MHNIKHIRENSQEFEKSLQYRNSNIDFKKILELDSKNRELIQKKENLEKQKKDISKVKDEKLFSKSKEISKQIEKITSEQNSIKLDLENILKSIPNVPLTDVPSGPDESSNKEVELKGNINKFTTKSTINSLKKKYE